MMPGNVIPLTAQGEDELRRAAEAIDTHFDGMLYDGMPLDHARWVEEQRDAAHSKMAAKIFQRAFSR